MSDNQANMIMEGHCPLSMYLQIVCLQCQSIVKTMFSRMYNFTGCMCVLSSRGPVLHRTVVLYTVSSMSQVCSVLESLEQEYKREEDWCGGADKLGPNSESDHVTPMISKHLEQKEAFLKVRQKARKDISNHLFLG